MKTKIYFIGVLFSLILFISCDKENTPQLLNKNTVLIESGYAPPTDLRLFNIILNPKYHTWKDLDEFYRNEVLTKYNDEKFFMNLRNMTINPMVNIFHLDEHGDHETLAFYVKELESLDFNSDLGAYSELLNGLNGYWSKDVIKLKASTTLDKNLKYINERFSDPDKYLGEISSKVDKLTQISNLGTLD